MELKESACVHEFSFNGFAGLFFIVDLGWLCDNQESQYWDVFYSEPEFPLVFGGFWDDRDLPFRSNVYLHTGRSRE